MIVIDTDLLLVHGVLSCNGRHGSYGSGGGSGGSVSISTKTFGGDESGSITANGGADTNLGGAGSGGRISISYETHTYTGSISAYGGGTSSSLFPGGPGTILYTDTVDSSKKLIIKNNGLAKSGVSFELIEHSVGGVAWVTETGEVDFRVVQLSENAGLAFRSATTISLNRKYHITFALTLEKWKLKH